MKAFLLWVLLWAGTEVAPVAAQEFSALARLDVAQSQVRDGGDGGLRVTLYMSQPVPYRAFTLSDPWRLVLDFRELDFRGASRQGLLNADAATGLRFGAFRPGWSRLVVDLAGPMKIDQAGMAVSRSDGTADLDVRLSPAATDVAQALAGAPPDPDWQDIEATFDPPPAAVEEGRTLIVIDPGHGGIDPGAEREGLRESELMLTLALELEEALRRSGFEVLLTRRTDVFVPLQERVSIARASGAALMVSLHADALEEDKLTSGAAIYTLAEGAQETSDERMVERHERGDIIAGLDLSGHDDAIATILMDLARAETGPAGQRLAQALKVALGDAGVRLNSHTLRQAPLAVLGAADFPAVLIETGFLSSAGDRADLTSPEGRARITTGITTAVRRWVADEEARALLIRQ